MQKDLVSILTPCYNTGAILYRLLDSILLQDYPFIEMYAINDGSKDNTEEVIISYIPKFEAKGYRLTYIYQENSGQSAAINNALKFVNGEFLTWPDSDDFYKEPYAISKLVETLKQQDADFAVARCIPTFVDEHLEREYKYHNLTSEYVKENQFENCLFSNNFIWPPGNYIVRMDAFLLVNPNKTIYVQKDAGQNWQMLLPIMYSYKCITLEESLFCVLERAASHSRGLYSTYEEQLKKISAYSNTILATLERISAMPHSEKLKYENEIIKKYKLQELELSVIFDKKDDERKLILELEALNAEIPYRKLRKIKFSKSFLGKLANLVIRLLRTTLGVLRKLKLKKA